MKIINLGEGELKMSNLWPNVFCKSIKETLEINRQSKKTERLSHSPTPFTSSGRIPGCWSWTLALPY